MIATCLAATVAASCTSQGASPQPSSLAGPIATATAEYAGRSHAPKEAVAVFQGPDPFVGLITPDEAARATALALADPAVQTRLAGARYAILDVTTPPEPSKESKETGPQTMPEVVVYDYTLDRWLAIPVDLSSGAVHPFKELDPEIDGQPPITTAEEAGALKIALANAEVAALTARGFLPNERPVRTGYLVPGVCVTARCVLVVFHDPLNRTALVQVDLGVERVLGIHQW
jgi:hypothetical protein